MTIPAGPFSTTDQSTAIVIYSGAAKGRDPEDSLARKLVSCLPIIGIIPGHINSKSLNAKIIDCKDSTWKVQLLKIKNDYIKASIIRDVLTVAIAVLALFFTIFAAIPLTLGIIGFAVAGFICISRFDKADVNQPKPGSFEKLPDEVVLQIFSHLNLGSLKTVCLVNRRWNRLANTHDQWKIAIYREIAFGNDKWAKCFGSDVVKDEDNNEEFSSLPWREYIADCKKFKEIFPKKKAIDCLMLVRLPKTLNGGLTITSLGKLAKKYFPESDSGYEYILNAIAQEHGDKSIDKSNWVLMTKNVLPESRGKSYDVQQRIVADLAKKSLISYEVPEILESAVCILSQYFGSTIRLFSYDPLTYTRCKDEVQGNQTVVGGFAPDGLDVHNYLFDNDSIGVAALRKF
jgi:hypothetical protein